MATRSVAGKLVMAVSMALVANGTHAGVTMRQLTDADLNTEHQVSKSFGAQAGDVLLRNDMIRVIVFSAPSSANPDRAGQCLILPLEVGSKAQPVRFTPAPAGGWGDVEAGLVASVAVVRFHRKDPKWSAELVYKLHESDSWIDVSTILRNQEAKQVLEVPIVDELHLPPIAKLDDSGERILYVTQKDARDTLAVISIEKDWNVRADSREIYALGSVSGDPEPPGFLSNSVSTMKFWNRKKQENLPRFNPVGGARWWHRSLRDKEDWYRLEPNTERTVERRLVSSVGLEETKTIVEAISDQKSPLVQLVPSGADIAPVAKSPTAGGRIVGQLRNASAQETAATKSPANTNSPKNVNVSKPVSRQSQVQIHEDQDMEEEIEVPAILDPTIEAIEDLPPPIE
ncbi:MAG: hypothetical protein U1D30_26010 [Planctomycetota bacterium]